MTKSKIIAGTLAAVTLTGAILGTSAPAFAWHPKHHRHHGITPAYGVGVALGAIATVVAAQDRAEADEPDEDCHYVQRGGHVHYGEVDTVEVCNDRRY